MGSTVQQPTGQSVGTGTAQTRAGSTAAATTTTSAETGQVGRYTGRAEAGPGEKVATEHVRHTELQEGRPLGRYARPVAGSELGRSGRRVQLQGGLRAERLQILQHSLVLQDHRLQYRRAGVVNDSTEWARPGPTKHTCGRACCTHTRTHKQTLRSKQNARRQNITKQHRHRQHNG